MQPSSRTAPVPRRRKDRDLARRKDTELGTEAGAVIKLGTVLHWPRVVRARSRPEDATFLGTWVQFGRLCRR